MKLKMIKGPRPGQKDMVCNTAAGTYSVRLGETIEVSEAAGHEIMTQWRQCFEIGTPVVEPKIVKTYKNKAIAAEAGTAPEAAAEAVL